MNQGRFRQCRRKICQSRLLYIAGIAAILHPCIFCTSDNAAEVVFAAHFAGVDTALYICIFRLSGNAADFPRAAHGAAAVGTAGNGAPYDKTAHGANIIVTVKGRTLHGNVLYGSVVCIADQTDIIYTCVRVGQPGDGFAVAVKYAFEPVGFCANGRPLRVFIYGDVVHQPGVDRSFAAVYGLGKPAQVTFVVDLVVTFAIFGGSW